LQIVESQAIYDDNHFFPVKFQLAIIKSITKLALQRFTGVHDLNCDPLICDAFRIRQPGCRMNVGKTLFAQGMEFVPRKTFTRIIERNKGDAGLRTPGYADLFRITVISQLTWRDSLRDIELCLDANQARLFQMALPRRRPAASRPMR
jgi:hypothetical protein